MNQQLSLLSLNSDEAIASLTTTYLAQEAVQNQITQLLQAHQLSPNAENYYNLGVYLAQNEYWDSAIASFLHAVSLQPTFVEAYYNLGAILQTQQQYKSAIALYHKALSIQVDSQYYYQLAVCLLQLGQAENNKQYEPLAIEYFLRRLQLQPDCKATYYALAEILEKQGNVLAASECDNFQLPTELIAQFYQLTPQNWQVLLPTQSHPQVRYCKLHDACLVPLTPPKTLDAEIHPALNRSNAHHSQATIVAEIQQGSVWCHSQADVVLTSDRHIIGMVSHGDGTLLDLERHLPPVSQTVGTVALLSVLAGQAFYHWMFELLPKVGLIRLAGINFDNIDKFIVNSYQASFHKETLQKLGIPSEKIITSSQSIHIQAESIIAPYFKSRSPWVCKFLRQEFLPKISPGDRYPERLYISRKNAAYRHLINQQQVSEFLSQIGFIEITLESYPFTEQVALVSAAKVVVSPHGAGLSHLVFCQPGTKVIEFFSPNYVTPYYWILSDLVNLDYFYLIGESNPDVNLDAIEEINYHYLTEDFSVSLPKLLETLKLAEVV